ncbi:hypothetical protein QTP88_028920 [Uroleucon formosanum]
MFKESKCNNSFQSLNSFRKHIQNKHISIENTVHVTTLNTSITASNHNNSGTDFQINVVESVKNYCNSDQPTSKRPKSNDNDFNINKCIETLHLNAVQFCLNLHNNNNFCKSNVVNIQDDIISKIINAITELIKGTIENEIKDTIILSTFFKLTLAISDIFKFCKTEHLLNNWLKNNELISNQSKQFTINNEINLISHNGQTVYEEVSTKAALNKSKDLKTFGNDLCFMKLVDEINSLEIDGIMIDTPEGPKTVYFIFGLLVGDNLGVNSISSKQLTHSLSHEGSTLLRNIDNFTEDVLKNYFSQTGIYKESILNGIQSFHVTTNFSIDVMHNIFEGICHYNMCHLIIYFTENVKMFSLETPNFRKQNFNYGLEQKKFSVPPKNFWCFRYEAKHKDFKMYARAITSRKNICLTLANKYQFKFAHFLLSQKYDYLEINKSVKNISKSQKVSTTYKTGNYLSSLINVVCLYKILAIIILKNDDIYFDFHQIQLECFRNKAAVSKSIMSIKQFSGPPINIIQFSGNKLMIQKYTELQSNNNQNYNCIENHSVVDDEYTPIEPELTNYTSTSDLSLTQNAFCLTINDKTQLKSTLEDWNMGYLSFISVPSVSTLLCQQVPPFCIYKGLNRSSRGSLITNYYKTNNNLNESCRNLMIDIIISNLAEKNISMTETYFVRNTENKCPKGKLYSKYFNKMRNLKIHVVEEDALTLISHLKHDIWLWPDIESTWEKTAVYRLKSLKNANFSYSEIQTIWVHYTKPLGYKLIDIDFQRLYQNAKDMLSIFDNTSTKLVQILNERVKVKEDCFNKLKGEEKEYTSKGSGFSFQYIDGILLGIYKYCPLSGSSYIQLPPCIDHKWAIINPQNADQLCFKRAILAKHVEGENKYRININYTKHEDKYSFEGISFPTPLSDIKKFEKNNQNVSINVYGVHKQYLPPPKLPTYKIFPLKVVDEEKRGHFDLLLVTENDKSHYIFIYEFSRLIRSQKTKHNGRIIFCKRCFTTFDDRDFEALLVKCDERKGESTTAFQKHMPVSYGVYVKAADNIPIELPDKFNIPTSIIVYRGSET